MSSIEYQEATVTGLASEVVRCVWTLRAPASDAPAEPIVSDGCVELVFNLRDPFERVADGNVQVQPKAMVVGPTTLPAVVRPTGTIDIVGIRLEPGAARRLLRLPLAELHDQFVALDDVLRRESPLRFLSEQLSSGTGWRIRWKQVTRAVAHSVEPSNDSTARSVVGLVRRHRGEALGVRRLAALAGRSVRSVERAFREDVGLTPKSLMRIERIQRVLTLARTRPDMSWSAIAAACGFHDQPHFVREFRALVGCAPSAFSRGDDTLTTAFLERETPDGED